VAEGSIDRDVPQQRVVFAVQNAPPHAGGEPGERLDVVFPSLETPDLFKDGSEVVLEGRYLASAPSPHFRADKLLAKCPSKFEGVEGEPTRSASLN
jgi:cytochrome c-type biogenesis protein CcmE